MYNDDTFFYKIDNDLDIDNEDEHIFSNDCCTAVQELLKILDDNNDFRYTNHRQGEIDTFINILS